MLHGDGGGVVGSGGWGGGIRSLGFGVSQEGDIIGLIMLRSNSVNLISCKYYYCIEYVLFLTCGKKQKYLHLLPLIPFPNIDVIDFYSLLCTLPAFIHANLCAHRNFSNSIMAFSMHIILQTVFLP